MTLAFDATTPASRAASSGDPFAFDHVPVGTPRAAVVLAAWNANIADIVGVTYGGSAMTMVAGRNFDSSGEQLSTAIYLLGTAVPTGTASVSVDLTSATTRAFEFQAVTYTAADDVELIDTDGLDQNVADPSVVMTTGGRSCLALSVVGSGRNTEADITPLAGMTNFREGNWSAQKAWSFDRQTTLSASDFTIGYTIVLDDIAFSAITISEKVTAPATLPARSQAIIIG